jgi:hypothetical protein
MAQGDFGGNGSVAWTIDVERLKQNSAHSAIAGGGPGHGNGRHHQDGTDDTQPGQVFTVYLKAPRVDRDRSGLATGLRNAADALEKANAGDRVAFRLPLENDNPGQIRVHWD